MDNAQESEILTKEEEEQSARKAKEAARKMNSPVDMDYSVEKKDNRQIEELIARAEADKNEQDTEE